MAFALAALVIVAAVVIGFYVYAEWRVVVPIWRRLPARPGLPPDIEYQCWTLMTDFDSARLSDAVVQAVELLAPIFGRATVFAAMRGCRLLVYREGTYPGGECGPAVNGVVLAPRWAAIELGMLGVAHALVHLIERHSGAPDYGHASWDKRGLTVVVATYVERRAGW